MLTPLRRGGREVTAFEPLIWGVAVTQLLGWGTLYYSFALVIGPMERELGWSKVDLNAGLTLGLFTASLAAIPVGRWIDRHGGFWPMTLGAVVAAILLVLWSVTQSLGFFYAVWIAIGLTHACTLGESAYNIVAANMRDYRRAIMAITLITGFSPTVSIPFISLAVEGLGWRHALLVLAGVQLLGPALISGIVLRGTVSAQQSNAAADDQTPRVYLPLSAALRDPALWAMAACFGAQIFTASGITFHIIPILQERGYGMGVIVMMLALHGPSQVASRLLLMLLGARISTAMLGRLSFGMLWLSLLLLCTGNLFGFPGLVLYTLLYGAASGLVIVVRTTSTLEYLGGYGYGAASGAMVVATVLPRTMAPMAFAMLWQATSDYDPVLWSLLLVIGGGMAAFWFVSSRQKA